MRSRFRYVAFGSLALVAAISAFVACSPATIKSTPLNARDDDSGSESSSSSSSSDTQLGESDAVQADGGKPPGRIYVHTASTLFVFDPLAANGAGTLTEIAGFDCLDPGDSMIDIAVDRAGKMYGTSFGGFLEISPADAKCKYIKRQSSVYPNSLAFMPIGTVDATKEALVGYGFDEDNVATQFVRIDTTDGTITKIGTMNKVTDAGAGLQTLYKASGDIIGLSRSGNRAYVTVRIIGDESSSDQLAEINPKTGEIKSVTGDTGIKQLYGLGQWAGQAYAFSGTGDVVKMDLDRGTATTIAIDAGSTVQWYGAGVTTLAPTKP